MKFNRLTYYIPTVISQNWVCDTKGVWFLWSAHLVTSVGKVRLLLSKILGWSKQLMPIFFSLETVLFLQIWKNVGIERIYKVNNYQVRFPDLCGRDEIFKTFPFSFPPFHKHHFLFFCALYHITFLFNSSLFFYGWKWFLNPWCLLFRS